MLEADSKWAKEHHLDFHPSITINDFSYRGDIEFADIREAICAAYQERPQHCNLDEIWSKESKNNVEAMDDDTHDKTNKRIKRMYVLGIFFFLFLVNFFIWLYLQRKTRRDYTDEVTSRVSAAMHEYGALVDHDNDSF